MLDTGTNAIIIVPLHPSMQGEIAECQVVSATVTGPIVQVYEFEGTRRLVVALPNSVILVSQEWSTTIAGWTFLAGPKPGLANSVCENKVYPAGAEASVVLSTKNGLPYLSKDLFCRAMKDIAAKAKLISGHDWTELREMLDNQKYEPQPQIYSVKTVEVPETPAVVLSATPRTQHFRPTEVRKGIKEWFEHFHPSPNLNRGRVTGTAPSMNH